MADFTVRSDHIDVEQIMRQIRARIRDKRGADYTEAEIRELASVKLDKFLDPRAVRSDLLLHYRRQHQPKPLIPPDEEQPTQYVFDPESVYASSRGTAGRILRAIRRLLNPILKLFFNPGPLLHVVSLQSRHNELLRRVHERLVQRDELDTLNFEMFNNLVVELTRLGIEVKNLRMQVESFGTRLDFDERRARALEGVVQYRPGAVVNKPPAAAPAAAATADESDDENADAAEGERGPRRRRRRRGRRRSGAGPLGQGPGGEGASAEGQSSEGGSDDAGDAFDSDDTPDTGRQGGDAGRQGGDAVSDTPAFEREPRREPGPDSFTASSSSSPASTPSTSPSSSSDDRQDGPRTHDQDDDEPPTS